MQFEKTKAIILQKIPVKDFKYLLKLYSEKHGMISADVEINNFIQPAYIQVPNICDILLLRNKYKKLSVREVKPAYIYKHLFSDIKKNIIAQFITEILLKTIKDEFSDEKLFQLTYQTLIQLDNSENHTLYIFHLNFLKNYIKLSGHYPLNNYSSDCIYFNLSEGKFLSHSNHQVLSKEDSAYIYRFLFDNSFEPDETFPVLRITHHLLDYMKQHLGLYELHALAFLKESLMEFEM